MKTYLPSHYLTYPCLGQGQAVPTVADAVAAAVAHPRVPDDLYHHHLVDIQPIIKYLIIYVCT